MPKASGSRLTPVQVRDPNPVAVTPIKLTAKQNGPHHRGLSAVAPRPSNAHAADAIGQARGGGSINVQKQY